MSRTFDAEDRLQQMKAAAAEANAASLEKSPFERRELVALLGAMAGLAVSACEPATAQDQESIDRNVESLTGPNLAWVDTILGAAPPAARTGDLATKNSGNMGNAKVVIARGCVTANDGGGGVFRWDSTSTSGDNGGTIIVPTVGGGRWVRIYSGPLDVLWFGARGDGSANDTPACQAALTTAGNAGGGKVLLPQGTYKITTTLTVPSKVTLLGAGMGKTTIYMPAASFTNTTFRSYGPTSLAIEASGQLGSPYTPAQNITLRDFTLKSEVSDGRCLYPIRASNVVNLEIVHVEVTGIPTGTLIELNSVQGMSAVHHCYLHDCGTAVITYGMGVQPQTTGIEIDNNKVNGQPSHGADIHDNFIFGLSFSGAALSGYGDQSDAINAQDGIGLRIHDNYARFVGEGVDLFASDCVVHGNVLVDCYHAGIKLIHGASRNNIHGNHILRPGRSGVSLSGVSAATIDNYIHDNNIHDVNSSNVWAARSTAALHTISGGGVEANNNTFARNKVTGGAPNMQYVICNEAGADNRFIDNEAESWALAYSIVDGGSATIVNAKKTLVRAHVGSNQGIDTGAGEVRVNYATGQTDTQGEYDALTSVFTAKSHRRLRVYATVRFSGVGSGEKYQLRIRKNDTEQVNNIQIAPLSAEFMFDVSDTLEVVPGDSVDVTLQHDSDSSRTITGNNLLSYLRIEEVAG